MNGTFGWIDAATLGFGFAFAGVWTLLVAPRLRHWLNRSRTK
ncbi:MAG: hypothetical protein ACRENY_04235 [Candidatus Dormibacteria bacterium]